MTPINLFIQELLREFTQDIDQLLTLDALFTALTIYVLVVWLACIVWVIKDITSRSHNIFAQVCSILLIIGFTPIFGLPIYLLIRPKTTLFERFYEESSLQWLQTKDSSICPKCSEHNAITAKFCRSCGTGLELLCKGCRTPITSDQSYCSECGLCTTTPPPAAAKLTKRSPKKMVKTEV